MENIFHCADIHPGLGKQGSTQKVNKQCCVVYRSETHWLSYQNFSLMSKYTLKIRFSERFFKCIYNSHNLFEKILFNESTQCHTFLGILCPPSSESKSWYLTTHGVSLDHRNVSSITWFRYLK